MQRVQKIHEYIDTLLVVAVLYTEGSILDRLEQHFFRNHTLIFVGCILFFVLVFKLLEWLITKLIKNSASIREFILGEDFIEGIWFDATVEDSNRTYGLFTNSYHGTEIEQNGELYSAECLPLNSWTSIASSYKEGTLILVYKVNYVQEEIIEQRLGILTISFAKTEKQKSPKTIIGTFYDVSENIKSKSFYGFKVTDKAILKELSHPETKRQAIRKLIDSHFFKEHEELAPRSKKNGLKTFFGIFTRSKRNKGK